MASANAWFEKGGESRDEGSGSGTTQEIKEAGTAAELCSLSWCPHQIWRLWWSPSLIWLQIASMGFETQGIGIWSHSSLHQRCVYMWEIIPRDDHLVFPSIFNTSCLPVSNLRESFFISSLLHFPQKLCWGKRKKKSKLSLKQISSMFCFLTTTRRDSICILCSVDMSYCDCSHINWHSRAGWEIFYPFLKNFRD